jgi:hypothetical protein
MRSEYPTRQRTTASSAQGSSQPHVLVAAAPDRVTEKVLMALLVLGIGHLLLYFLLTGDARSALQVLESRYKGSSLETTVPAGPAAMPGTPAYSVWLRSYERWHAAKDYAMHGRHESLMRYGMLASFLIALGFLGSGLWRHARSSRVAECASERAARAPVPLAAHGRAQRPRYRRSA